MTFSLSAGTWYLYPVRVQLGRVFFRAICSTSPSPTFFLETGVTLPESVESGILSVGNCPEFHTSLNREK